MLGYKLMIGENLQSEPCSSLRTAGERRFGVMWNWFNPGSVRFPKDGILSREATDSSSGCLPPAADSLLVEVLCSNIGKYFRGQFIRPCPTNWHATIEQPWFIRGGRPIETPTAGIYSERHISLDPLLSWKQLCLPVTSAGALRSPTSRRTSWQTVLDVGAAYRMF